MKKTIILCTMSLWCAAVVAQTNPSPAYKAFESHPMLSASNYTDYNELYSCTDHSMTPPPAGYAPFYVSTYARHGSRWLINKEQYDAPVSFLEAASANGGLTKKGAALLNELRKLRRLSPDDKLGVLTDVGFEQHNGIAKRLCERFPEVFDNKAYIHARSSRTHRCIKSMAEEAEVISLKTKVWVVQEAGRRDWQSYIAHSPLPQRIADSIARSSSIVDNARKQLTRPARLVASLIKRPERMEEKDKIDFMEKLFDLAGNMQSHKAANGFDMNLQKYFTADERYDLWRLTNLWWYLSYAAAPQTGGIAPWRQMWLLKDFVNAADTLVCRQEFHGATLRFGHESCLMPLAALMEVGNAGAQVACLDTLDRVWRNYEIFPMASNIQLVFYRKGTDNDEILVKAMLNEREVSLPVKPVSYPYYRWDDVRAYWMKKILRYKL